MQIGSNLAFHAIAQFKEVSTSGRPVAVTVFDAATLYAGLIARCWVEEEWD
jgi:hypothetical protein